MTQAQYERVTGKNPSAFGGSSLPVETVSQTDALKFCQKLSELPAEKAARRLGMAEPEDPSRHLGCLRQIALLCRSL
ncbi:MAG: hypothetical protein NTV55_00005, partial [Planctomycetota bacterium]|nr:hypothetical protein [Planctomycetota bacterium]